MVIPLLAMATPQHRIAQEWYETVERHWVEQRVIDFIANYIGAVNCYIDLVVVLHIHEENPVPMFIELWDTRTDTLVMYGCNPQHTELTDDQRAELVSEPIDNCTLYYELKPDQEAATLYWDVEEDNDIFIV